MTGTGNCLNNRVEGDDGNTLLSGVSDVDTRDASYGVIADTTPQGGDRLVGGQDAGTFGFETSLVRDNVIDFADTTGPKTAYDGLDVISVTAFAPSTEALRSPSIN